MRILKDIRFWLVLGFVVRLIGITNEPLESHAWRQVVTNMAAKNFLNHNPNILFPAVDIMFFETTNTAGVSSMEFPLYNYTITLVAKIFGWTEWYGRLINLIVSTFGLWYFYLLVRDYLGKKLAELSTYLLMLSIWLTFSRKIMPDTFSMSLAIIGLYYGLKYLYELKSEKKNLFYFFLFSTMGILAKIPAIYIFCIVPLWDRIISLPKRLTLTFVGLLGLIPVYWWYFVWCPELIVRFNNRMFFPGKNILLGAQEIYAHLWEFKDHFTKFAFSYSGFALLLIGLFLLFKNKEKKILVIVLTLSSVFLMFVLKSGNNFIHHNYYIIPFTPVLCLIAAYGLTRIQKPWLLSLLLVAYTVDNISRKQHDFRIPKREHYRLETKGLVDQYIPKSSLIIINGGPNPVDIYYTDRKGWSLNSPEMTHEKVEILRQRGPTHMLINKHNGGLNYSYKLLFENQNLKIYEL